MSPSQGKQNGNLWLPFPLPQEVGIRPHHRLFPLTLTLSLKGEGTAGTRVLLWEPFFNGEKQMHTTYSTFLLAGQTVHQITFDATTFTDADLLWLPHHEQLLHAGRKRKADHLAGRIAAFHALNRQAIPGIGSSGEPLWPVGISGSISHSGNQAIAICRKKGVVGIDCEAIIDESEAREIQDGVINAQEAQLLMECGLPFNLAFTLAFSAKESLFKALFPQVQAWMGFESARVTALAANTLTLTLTRPLPPCVQNQPFTLHWCRLDSGVLTLICDA